MEKRYVENLFLILGGIFALGMIILMVKYAKFIHVQPKVEAERRKMKDNGLSNSEKNPDINP
tara:strand:- start:508 stop:693 length:186 start_codon:yes stop_codon:yes gene_type:complete